MNFRNILLSIVFLVTQIGFAPILGANVVILNQGKEQKGTTSDIDGNFTLETNKREIFDLVISYVGYENFEATVTKELIADRQAFQLPDAVKTVSNVALTGLYNHYNIRGITQADDGQVVNGMRTRQFYFLQPITSHLERVEVIKGPSSVTFSSADPGGTVNMVTKKPLTEKRREVLMQLFKRQIHSGMW